MQRRLMRAFAKPAMADMLLLALSTQRSSDQSQIGALQQQVALLQQQVAA
jgi:hypothetical protein